MPPEAARVWEYGVVARPLGRDVVVTSDGGADDDRERLRSGLGSGRGAICSLDREVEGAGRCGSAGDCAGGAEAEASGKRARGERPRVAGRAASGGQRL